MDETPHSPTKAEWIQILEASARLQMDSDAARGVRARRLPQPVTEETITQEDMDAITVLDYIVPTYFLIKLHVLMDWTVDALYRDRFPGRNQDLGRVSKLRELSRVIDINNDRLKTLVDLRNGCAHEFTKEVTWEEFDQQHHSFICLREWLINESLRSLNR